MGLPLRDLIRAIRGGDYDHRLDDVATKVYKAVHDRKEAVALEMASELQEGDLVKVKAGSFKPKYFVGQIGTVDEFNGPTVWVQLRRPLKRRKGNIERIGVSAFYLEKL